MTKRLTPLLLLLLALCLPAMGHASKSPFASSDGLRELGEPTIRLTTSTEIGADCSFRFSGAATSIQVDWGDGTLATISPIAPRIKGKKAGEEIKIYGECEIFLAPEAHITSISINSQKLGVLSLENNELTTLDHVNAPKLVTLKIKNNKLTSFHYKELKSLSTVDLRRNDLASINLTGLDNLKNLDVSYNARLSAIDGSAMPSLTSIKADSCALEQVALPEQIAEFYAMGNKLTKLGEGDVAYPKLQRLRLQGNDFAELTFGECPLLYDLELEGNKLTSLTLGSLSALKTLYLQENLLEADALNKIYKDLPTIAGTINVADNPGAEQAYGYIAKDKGWTIDILGQENKLGEPTIRLTTSTEIGADCSFRIMGDGSTPIQIDWGDGTLTTVSPTSPGAKGKKAGDEIKVYGNCSVLMAPGANITSIAINSEQLGMLSLENNELTTLDHVNAPNLGILKIQNNKLTSFHYKELKSLSTVDLRRNDLASINLTGLDNLKNLDVSYNARLSAIDGSAMPSLTSIKADSCALEQVALPEQIAEFYAMGNKLTKLGEGDVAYPKLQRLRLQGNDFAELTFGECPLLNDLELEGNKLTALTLGTLPSLRTLLLQGNLLEADALNKVYNALPTLSGTIKVADNPGAEKALGYIATDKGWEIDIPGQKSQDPDPVITIKTKPDKEINLGLSGFAAESKVQIETDEGVVVEETITSGTPPIKKYKSTRGLVRITGLVHTIDCSENGSIAYDIDASQSPKLVKFYALHNTMTSVNVKGCADLTFINCAGSELPEIDLSDCKQLETVWLPGNKMTSIDLTGLTNLQELSLERNLLTEIHGLSDCTKLTELNVAENELTTLALTGLSSLNKLDCRENKLTALDLSSCTALTEAFCYKNAIKEPAMKQLFESLPTRSTSERGELYAINSSDRDEENKVNDADVKIASDKFWLVYDYKNYDNGGKNPLANDPVVSADHYRLMVTGDYIEIAQATPHAVVELYALDGTLLQSARADQSGDLRLSIAELPAGSYLLSVDGEATKVIL
ncbi:leucine-rich repeat domain-containing protein [uncultured Porphyromonas sp.]|uniref:leucine-rich repeat domain-containing protein n=1 Tax=uncultured Porphyromonas sp. TaxID=159274 RepID=UPI00263A0041|nr:hypothetical protein [uncultured Porphyromonas sp.]